MTEKQAALLDFHMDNARLLTSTDEVFWVLELTDSNGFNMAAAAESIANGLDEAAAEAKLRFRRDEILAKHCHPAFTLTMSIKDSNRALEHGWNITKGIPPGNRYIAVVADGKLTVAIVRAFSTDQQTQTERNVKSHGTRQTQTHRSN